MMYAIENRDWDEAHNLFTGTGMQNCSVSKIKLIRDWDCYWEAEFKNAPNAKLLIASSFLDTLRYDKKIYLLHLTSTMEQIKQSEHLYCSAGCLVGSPYFTHLHINNGRFELNNLGRFIYEREIPLIKKVNKDNSPTNAIIIEVDNHNQSNTLSGINYLALGSIHYKIYKSLEYILPYYDRMKLAGEIISMIRPALHNLRIINDYLVNKKRSEDIYTLLVDSAKTIKPIGYILFEAMSEYFALYSTYCGGSDLDSEGPKDLLYTLYPEQAKKFDLACFHPTMKMLSSWMRKNRPSINIDHFSKYMIDRSCFLVGKYLGVSEYFKNKGLDWNDDNNILSNQQLVGHIIHRIIRSYDRYQDFYYYFDQTKALNVWNYWNMSDIAIPFNGIIPKGEAGINPAYGSLDYKTYAARIVGGNKNIRTHAIPLKQINVRIAPRLVDLKFTYMRNKI